MLFRHGLLRARVIDCLLNTPSALFIHRPLMLSSIYTQHKALRGAELSGGLRGFGAAGCLAGKPRQRAAGARAGRIRRGTRGRGGGARGRWGVRGRGRGTGRGEGG